MLFGDGANRLRKRAFRLRAAAGLCVVGALFMPAFSEAYAKTQGGSQFSFDLVEMLLVAAPLAPLLAGVGLYRLTRSHLIAAGLPALVFGLLSALFFSLLSMDGPLSGALYGLGGEGVFNGLLALAGSGYAHLIEAEARRLGAKRTAIVHIVGVAIAMAAFVLFFVTNGSNEVGNGLYFAVLAWSFAAAAATDSFLGVVATMAFALVAMVHGGWAAALASGARDAGQAYIAIFFAPPLLAPVIALAAIGRWLGRSFRTAKP